MHMTTLDSSSSSSAESIMDDASNTTTATNNHHAVKHQKQTLNTTTTNNNLPKEAAEEGDPDPEFWENFNDSFRQVQSVLDRNRRLIQQVNDNHQSKIPDNMVKNVALIQEINGNISKVVSLYSDFSSNFSSLFHQRKKNGDGDKEETMEP